MRLHVSIFAVIVLAAACTKEAEKPVVTVPPVKPPAVEKWFDASVYDREFDRCVAKSKRKPDEVRECHHSAVRKSWKDRPAAG